MRVYLTGLVSLWALLQCGCVIENKVSVGQKPSAEGLEFLNLSDASRQEVVATLGQPDFESETNRILVYIWKETLEMRSLVEGLPAAQDDNHSSQDCPSNNGSSGINQNAKPAKPVDKWKELRRAGTVAGHELAKAILESGSPPPAGSDSLSLGKSQNWGLFIAFDEDGKVTAHTGWKTEVDPASLEKKCMEWRKNGTRTNLYFKVIRLEPPPTAQTRR